MLIGIDISKWNYGWNPDKAKKPIGFVIQRASYGYTKDEKFDVIYPNVKKIGIRGAYHYYVSYVNWKAQADKFLSIVKGLDFHFYVIDYERYGNTLDRRTIAELYEFVKYVKNTTNKRVLVYLNPDIYNTAVAPYGYSSWLNSCDIWIAQYPFSITQQPIAKQPALPKGLNHWDIWQFGGADGNFTAGRSAGADYGGGLVGMDLNYYNGSLEDMQKWLGISIAPPPPPVPDPVPGPVSKIKYPALYVIKDDLEAGIVSKGGTRPYIRNGLPCTVRIHSETPLGKEGRSSVKLPDAWMQFARKIQTPSGLKYQFNDDGTFRPSIGWHNQGDGDRIEYVAFGGNALKVLKVVGNKAYIDSYSVTVAPPNSYHLPLPNDLDTKIQLFTVQYPTHLDLSGLGKFPKTFLISNKDEVLWIDIRDIKFVREL